MRIVDTNKVYEGDSSSVDSEEAFMEMLGFSSCGGLPTSLDVSDQVDVPISDDAVIKKSSSCENLEVPVGSSRHQVDPSDCLALVLDNVLTANQCQSIVDLAQNRFRYITEATHKALDGTSYTVEIQNPNPHKLSAVDTDHDPQVSTGSQQKDVGTLLMDYLYITIGNATESDLSFQSFRKRTKCGSMQGLNPRMRVLKYDASDNDRFEAHFDATTFVAGKLGSQKRKSLITVLVYLNDGAGDDFQGGETLFLQNSTSNKDKRVSVKVIPKTGRVCIFEHDLFHSGAPLEFGTKFIMRTDILFEDNEMEELTCNQKEEEEQVGNILVSDLCMELQVPDTMIQALKSIDLFNVTCETLLAPGKTFVSQILMDYGLDESLVESLVEKANSVMLKN